MLLGSTLSWSGLLIGCSFTSPWVVPNSLLVGLTLLVTVSPWTVLVTVLDSLLAGPIDVLVTVSPWTVLSIVLVTVSLWTVLSIVLVTVSLWTVVLTVLVLLRLIPLIFLLWFLLILLPGRTLAN